MAELPLTWYGTAGEWHPDGWCLYPDGSTFAWPDDLTAPDANNLRYSESMKAAFYKYKDAGKHGHLYYDPSRGYLVNSRTGGAVRISDGRRRGTFWPWSYASTHAWRYEFQRIAPADARGVTKWKMVAILNDDWDGKSSGLGPGEPDPKAGHTFSQWPPRAPRRKR